MAEKGKIGRIFHPQMESGNRLYSTFAKKESWSQSEPPSSIHEGGQASEYLLFVALSDSEEHALNLPKGSRFRTNRMLVSPSALLGPGLSTAQRLTLDLGILSGYLTPPVVGIEGWAAIAPVPAPLTCTVRSSK
jgi:hypothetical protein